ncbi:hypothetical protein DIPPA_24469 [Diplonema papillatum]|nr:hypothetical protein DIPPA_12245 [Diplonema papillatum]KAJ9466910.1 hypothetical protein DIPPA_24469 [Diplonema papillatum]
MWHFILQGLAFCAVSAVVLVASIRIFILKSSRETPVYRLNTHRAADEQNWTKAKWVESLLLQLCKVYTECLEPGRKRAWVESQFSSIARLMNGKIEVRSLKPGNVVPVIDGISVWDDDDGTVTLGLQLSYRGDQTASGPNSSGFQANLTAEYPFRARGIGRCVLPVDVTIADVAVEFDLRLSWTPKSTSQHHFRFWFSSPPVVRANTSIQLGSAPKTIESPFVISSLRRLLDAVLASVVHPNSFRWAVHCQLPFTAHHAAPRRQPSVSTPKLTSPPIPQSTVIRRKRRLSSPRSTG